MTLEELAAALTALGCPPDQSGEMARQLDRRARQLAAHKGRSYEAALEHLLALMQQGWAAQAKGLQHANPATGKSLPGLAQTGRLGQRVIRPWTKRSSRALGDFSIFKLRADKSISPRTGQEHEFYVLDCVNWVNVVAVTPDHRLVMIEQFRHGTETVELEVPGGVMDSHEGSPVETAIRELREETGYEGENAQLIGTIFPNPAIMSNTCHTVLVTNCQFRQPVQFDLSEDLATRLVPATELPALVAEGHVRHSLVVVALYFYELWQRRSATR